MPPMQNAFVDGKQILDATLIAKGTFVSLLKHTESGVLCNVSLI